MTSLYTLSKIRLDTELKAASLLGSSLRLKNKEKTKKIYKIELWMAKFSYNLTFLYP